MNNDIEMKSQDYKEGFTHAIINVIQILSDNSNLTQTKLIDLLNIVVNEVDKVHHPRGP